MPITLKTPVIVPAKSEAAFNEVWLSFAQIRANANQPYIEVMPIVDMARTLESGLKEIDPSLRKQKPFRLHYADMTKEQLTVMYAFVKLAAELHGIALAEEA